MIFTLNTFEFNNKYYRRNSNGYMHGLLLRQLINGIIRTKTSSLALRRRYTRPKFSNPKERPKNMLSSTSKITASVYTEAGIPPIKHLTNPVYTSIRQPIVRHTLPLTLTYTFPDTSQICTISNKLICATNNLMIQC